MTLTKVSSSAILHHQGHNEFIIINVKFIAVVLFHVIVIIVISIIIMHDIGNEWP